MLTIAVNVCMFYYAVLYFERHHDVVGLMLFPIIAGLGTVICSIAEVQLAVLQFPPCAMRVQPSVPPQHRSPASLR